MQTLVLDHNAIGDAGFATLASGLKRCAALKKLSLAYCGLTGAATNLLADILTPSDTLQVSVMQPHLEYINLSGNALGAPGLLQLSSGLKTCESIGSVALLSVGVQDQDMGAVQALVEAMAVNSTFAFLDFRGNDIGKPLHDESAVAVLREFSLFVPSSLTIWSFSPLLQHSSCCKHVWRALAVPLAVAQECCSQHALGAAVHQARQHNHKTER